MFSRFFINRPIFASVLSIVVVLAGFVALSSLPVAHYPEITPPTVEVSAVYPGANAQVIADTEHILDKGAAMASTLAAYDRRMDDWKFQHDLAAKEAQQLDSSIEAARLRVTAAQDELDVHKLQLANARAVDEFMRTKYTAEEPYQWHIGQISGVYFQSYKLAYDLARQAERCYRFELGIADYGQYGPESVRRLLQDATGLQMSIVRLTMEWSPGQVAIGPTQQQILQVARQFPRLHVIYTLSFDRGRDAPTTEAARGGLNTTRTP